MMPPIWLPLSYFSLFVTPARGHLMVALKGYFDESGKQDDPQHSDLACVLAGYVAPHGCRKRQNENGSMC
jgi:hypothetical protein